MTFTRILIAVDSSPIAAHAAEVGLQLARALGAEIGLISVVDTRDIGAVASEISPDQLLATAREDARRAIEDARTQMPDRAPPLEFVPEGSPDAEIVKAAEQWPADLIVIGTHGRGGLGRVLLGSVAEAVMRHAPCPVLTVRAKR